MGCSKLPAVLIFAVVVMMVTSRRAEGQTPSCAEKLVPCANYINTTGTPPASCCDPLKDAVENEAECLCNLYNTPGLLASLGINVTQAMFLPGRCKISGNLNSCKASSPTSPSSQPPPPATPGSNGVGRIGWTGLPSLLLLWASMMLY